MKTYGRLIGSTGAQAYNDTTASVARAAPYTAQTPGSKAFARGENATHETMNRVVEALAKNDEYVMNLLGSPALRDTVLHPDSAGYGFDSLVDVEQGATSISLDYAAPPLRSPPTWIYHGLYKSTVGRFIRLVRDHNGPGAADSDMSYADVVEPTDVLDSTSTSVFPASVLHGASPDQSARSFIAPMRVLSGISNFDTGADAALSCGVNEWSHDGFTLNGQTWSSMFVRPGVYVQVTGCTSVPANNGLYRVERTINSNDTANDKATLSRGGLHKVVVTPGVGGFTAGSLVKWRPAPDEATALPPTLPVELSMQAYVVFATGGPPATTLYLAQVSGQEDFPKAGFSGVDAEGIGTVAPRLATGTVGMFDAEASAATDLSLVAGTILYSHDEAITATVDSVVHAGAPLHFELADDLDGTAYVVNPPGFFLGPILSFAANTVMGGNYRIDCRTLTTVREQLVSQGSSGTVGGYEDPSSTLGLSRNERTLLLNWMTGLKQGRYSDMSAFKYYPPFAPPRNLLGEDRWVIVASADVTGSYSAGDVVWFTRPTQVVQQVTSAVIRSISADGLTLVLDSVTNAQWNPAENFSQDPIAALDAFNLGGFTVASVTYKPLIDGVVPSFGLDAAYRNAYSNNATERQTGFGRFIQIEHAARPVSILMNAGFEEALSVYSDETQVNALRVRSRSDGGTTLRAIFGAKVDVHDGATIWSKDSYLQLRSAADALKAALGFGTDALTFRDVNTAADIALSDVTKATNDHLPLAVASQATSILGVLHSALQGVPDVNTSATDDVPFLVQGARVAGDALLGQPGGVTWSAAPTDTTVTATVVGGTAVTTSAAHGLAGGEIVRVGPLSDGTYHYSDIVLVDPDEFTLNVACPEDGAGFGLFEVTDPLTVKVGESVIAALGATFRVAEHTLVIGTSQTRYVVWQASTNAVTLDPDFAATADGPGRVLLARVKSNAFCLYEFVDCAVRTSRLDKKVSLTVGKLGDDTSEAGEYANDETHFRTLGAALKAIEVLESANAKHTGNERSWHIRIVGPCTEASNPEAGILLPYAVPAHGIVIEGGAQQVRGAPAATLPVVSWGDNVPLLDLNDKNGLVVKDLNVHWTGAAATAAASVIPSAVLLGNKPVSGARNTSGFATLERVHQYGGASLVYLDDFSGSDGGRLRVADCSIDNHVAGAVMLNDVTQPASNYTAIEIDELEVINNSLNEIAAHSTAVDIRYIAAAHVRGVRARNFRYSGVYIFGHGLTVNASVRDCKLTSDGVSEPSTYGVFIDGAVRTAVVSNCWVDLSTNAQASGFGTGADNVVFDNCYTKQGTRGFFVDAAYCRVVGNTVATSENGIGLTANATHCHVSGNTVVSATSGYGISIAGEHCRVTANEVSSVTGGDGISVAATADYSVITGNTVGTVATAGECGIDSDAGAVQIGDNVVEAVTLGYGIRSTGGRAVLLGNTVFEAGLDGITASGVQSAITGNIVRLSGDDGIICAGAYSTMTGNTVTNAVDKAFACTASHCVISGNTAGTTPAPAAAATIAYGVHCSGEHVLISGNTVLAASNSSIRSSAVYNHIVGNKIVDGGWLTTSVSALHATGADAVVRDNHIWMAADADGGGFSIKTEGSDAVVAGNVVRGSVALSASIEITGQSSSAISNEAHNHEINVAGTASLAKDNFCENLYIGGVALSASTRVVGNAVDDSIIVDAASSGGHRFVGNYMRTGTIDLGNSGLGAAGLNKLMHNTIGAGLNILNAQAAEVIGGGNNVYTANI